MIGKSRKHVVVVLSILLGAAMFLAYHKYDKGLGVEAYQPNTMYCTGHLSKVCHYTFSERMEHNIMVYTSLLISLRTAAPTTTLYLYVAGQGGSSDSAGAISSAIQMSNARVITVISGSARSAHGIVALSGHEVIVRRNAYVLLHKPAYGQPIELLCESKKGLKDRNQDAHKKCIDKYTTALNALIQDRSELLSPLLSEADLQGFLEGYDILLTNSQLKEMFNND